MATARSALDTAYRALTEPTAIAYRRLGLSPGPTVCVELAAAAINTDRGAAEEHLAELAEAGLLRTMDRQIFWFRDTVFAHARNSTDIDNPHTRAAAMRRIAHWYLLVTRAAAATVLPARRELPWESAVTSPPYLLPDRLDDHATALGWLDRERRSLGALVAEAVRRRWFPVAVLLADALQPGVTIHRDDATVADIDELALQAAVTLGDRDAERCIRNRLARLHARMGDLNRAGHHVRVLLRNPELTGGAADLASALTSQALIDRARGHRDAAVATLIDVVGRERELGRRRFEGLALIELGGVLLDLGRPGDAAGYLDHSRTLLSTLDIPDRFHAARAEVALARAQASTGDVDTAHVMATRALATMIELDSPSEQARAYGVLADLFEHAGNLDRSRGFRAIVEALRSGVAGG